MRHATLALLLGAALLAGCGGDDMTADGAGTTPAAVSAAAPTDTVRMKDFDFVPSPATVTAGQTIAVPNDDDAPHTLTDRPASGEARFDTGTVDGRQRGTFTAPAPGTYAIFCVIHPTMKGELVVVE